MQLFYAPDIATSTTLPEDEAQHALRVLRLGEGSAINLTDGKGFFYKAVITKINHRQCEVGVSERWPQPALWPFHLHIALAPTKNIDRIEWFCEKATEIGIDSITFLHCRFSERRELKTSRLEKILISAMKQSGKATLPQLGAITNFQTFITHPFNGRKLIAHCEKEEKPLLKHACRPGENALILIGPEGDFSPEEIKSATAHDFTPISLGNTRLRTETAALVACQTIHFINE
jgi:16S rRNA (uracil1498-N3)-methyltransferase